MPQRNANDTTKKVEVPRTAPTRAMAPKPEQNALEQRGAGEA